MFSIAGIKQAGRGVATRNIGIQLPMITAEFPEVAHCHHGTINLLLDIPLLVISPDHRTRPLQWHPEFGSGEVFDFLRITLEAPTGAAAVPAWLYIPHESPHRGDLRIYEVLAPELDISDGERCLVHVERKVTKIPYREWPEIAVV